MATNVVLTHGLQTIPKVKVVTTDLKAMGLAAGGKLGSSHPLGYSPAGMLTTLNSDTFLRLCADFPSSPGHIPRFKRCPHLEHRGHPAGACAHPGPSQLRKSDAYRPRATTDRRKGIR